MAVLSRSSSFVPVLARARDLLTRWARTVRASVGALAAVLRRWRPPGAPDPLADLVRTAERLHYGGGGR